MVASLGHTFNNKIYSIWRKKPSQNVDAYKYIDYTDNKIISLLIFSPVVQ